MKTNLYSSERGQAVVILVLAMIVLLGFTALAVDGSMIYSDRRYAQDGADASSLSGGGAAANKFETLGVNSQTWDSTSENCNGAKVGQAAAVAKTAAINRAQDNDFPIQERANLAALNAADEGVALFCHNPAPADIFPQYYMDVHTKVFMNTKTAFAHFVGQNIVRNTLVAVTRVRPRSPLAFGYAIVALNKTGNCTNLGEGAGFHGNTTTTVNGGGIFSNGCLVAKDTAVGVDVNGAGVVYGSTANLHTPNPITVDPGYAIQKTNQPMPPEAYYVDPPDCSQVPDYTSGNYKNFSGHLPAGRYDEVTLKNDVTLEGGGLYCIDTNFDTGNANVSIDTSNGKQGVTIYLIGGDFSTGGNGTVNIVAPPPSPDPSPALPGILIYRKPGDSGCPSSLQDKCDITIVGNSTSIYRGVVLAPTCMITEEGNGAMTGILSTQLVGCDVKIGGNTPVTVNYNGDDLFSKPTYIDLYR
jgi:hypothetical protein